MTTQSPWNKGQCSSVGPAQPKGKLRPIDTPRKRFPCNSEIKCSAYSRGLLTYIVHPCTPSPLTSRCQLAPPAPSPLAHELTLRRRRRRHPRTVPAATASPYHRLRPVPSGTRAARRRRCAPPPFPRSLRECRIRCPRSCLRPPQQQAAAASPCPRLRPLTGTCAAAAASFASPIPRRPCECRLRRRSRFVPRVSRPRYDFRRHRRRCRSRGCFNPTTEQASATATYHAAKYFRPSLNCLPSFPSSPREISRHFFFLFDLLSPPPGTEAYQLAPGNVGQVAFEK
jgi:hypothetical protein